MSTKMGNVGFIVDGTINASCYLRNYMDLNTVSLKYEKVPEIQMSPQIRIRINGMKPVWVSPGMNARVAFTGGYLC